MKIVPLWKHPNYTISDIGIITNVITNKVSALSLNKEGYLVVKINYTQYLLHRLLMYSMSMQLKRERSNLIQEFCIKFNISYSVVGRIIRKDGRYNNGF